jgi:iron(III) transport system substrate-binding protein
MPRLYSRPIASFAALALVAGWAGSTAADTIPSSALKALKKAGLAAADLKGGEKDMAVPQAWIDGSKKEGKLLFRFNVSPKHYEEMFAPFRERYPWVKIEYTRGVGAGRAVKPLAAFKAGRLIADIVGAFGSSMEDYMKANALLKIDDLPSWNNVPANRKDASGRWSGYQLANWCMSYNKDKVKKSDLPATWKDLISPNSPLKGGKVGIGNRAHLWLINLWGAEGYGPDYVTRTFIPGIFSNLKPQLRTEGIDALIKLASVGEFNVSIPSAAYRVLIQVKRGANVGFHCPEPVPQYFTEVGIFGNSPNVNSARLLVNWVLSREGQLMQYAVTFSAPIHKDLSGAKYFPYGDEIKGKKVALRTIPLLVNELPKVYTAWRPAWQAAGGKGK